MCEYCDVNSDEFIGYNQSTKDFDGDYEDAVIIKTNNSIDKSFYFKEIAEPNKYYLMVEGDGVGITPISFCPMCGRRLIE